MNTVFSVKKRGNFTVWNKTVKIFIYLCLDPSILTVPLPSPIATRTSHYRLVSTSSRSVTKSLQRFPILGIWLFPIPSLFSLEWMY